MRYEYNIWLQVPCGDLKEWEKINKIARKIDKNDAGAGTSGGVRDIDWYKKTKKEADKLKSQLIKAFKIEGMKAEVSITKYEQI